MDTHGNVHVLIHYLLSNRVGYLTYFFISTADIINVRERVNEGAGSYEMAGFRFLIYQFQTCMLKKFIFTIRNWKAMVSQILLPVIFVTVAMFLGIIGGPKVQDEPPLEMSTAQYFNSSKGLGSHYVPYSDRQA